MADPTNAASIRSERKSVELIRSVVVEASVERTWAAATDWAAQGEWMPGTVVVVESAGPISAAGQADRGQAVGARLVARTGIGPLGFTDPMEITRWEPPRRCDVAHHGRVVRGSGAFEVRELPAGRSELVWSEWLELPFGAFGRGGWWVLRPVAAFALDVALRRFARWVPTRLARDLA